VRKIGMELLDAYRIVDRSPGGSADRLRLPQDGTQLVLHGKTVERLALVDARRLDKTAAFNCHQRGKEQEVVALYRRDPTVEQGRLRASDHLARRLALRGKRNRVDLDPQIRDGEAGRRRRDDRGRRGGLEMVEPDLVEARDILAIAQIDLSLHHGV